ncbi:hypothetical protein ERN12_16425 [Rhodobacteraceae bacterium]|nr:hypothetical protein ERN12_16425 [Paracoccaceae bacterium]
MGLLAHHVPTELITEDIVKDNYFVLSSRLEPDSFKDFFFGIGYGEDFIISGKPGFDKYKHENKNDSVRSLLIDGNFLIGENFENCFYINTDPIGGGTIFLWEKDSNWILSNSLLILCREMELMGYTPEIYPPALAVYSISKGGRDYGQIVSKRTAVKDAILLPSNEYIKIDFFNNKPEITVVKYFEKNIQNRSADNYKKELINFITQWRNIFNTFKHENEKVSISLSGGKDSRAALALLISGFGTGFYGYTFQNGSEDQKIATDILKEKNEPMKDEPTWFASGANLSSSEAYAMNLFRNAGVKRSVSFGGSVSSRQYLKVSGACAIDPVTMRGSMEFRINKIPQNEQMKNQKIKQWAFEEYLSAYDSSDLKVTDKNSKIHHYCDYRSRLHYGNVGFSNMDTSIMPLFSWGFLKVAMSAPTYKYLLGNRLNYDIINICCPDLMSYPFTGDLPEGGLISDDISAHSLQEPVVLNYYGSDKKSSKASYARVNGPKEKDLVKEILPLAISRFGSLFEDSFIRSAEYEVNNVDKSSEWKHARFICDLMYLFPN